MRRGTILAVLIVGLGAMSFYWGESCRDQLYNGESVKTEPSSKPQQIFSDAELSKESASSYADNNRTLLLQADLPWWFLSEPQIDSAGNILAVGVDLSVYKLGINGEIIWTYNQRRCDPTTPGAILPNDTFICLNAKRDALMAINLHGALSWQVNLENRLTSPIVVTASGRIIISLDDENGTILCIDKDGRILWKSPTGSELLGNFTPVIASNGSLYFPAFYNHIFEFDLDGNELSSFRLKTPMWDPARVLVDSEGNEVLIARTSEAIIGLDYSGKHLWDFSSSSTSSYLAPVVNGNRNIVFFNNSNREIIALNPNGTLAWKNKSGYLVGSKLILVDDDRIAYVTSDGRVAEVSAQGDVLWDYQISLAEGEAILSPIVKGKNSELLVFSGYKKNGGKMYVFSRAKDTS